MNNLRMVMELLEDDKLVVLSRSKNYEEIQRILESLSFVIGKESVADLERLLALCAHDFKQDVKTILNIITLILKKVKGQGAPLSQINFTQSAKAILDFLQTTALTHVEGLTLMCFNTLLLYPDDTLLDLEVSHRKELIGTFYLYCEKGISLKIQLVVIDVIHRLLKLLPPQGKQLLVKSGIAIWFSGVLPTVVSHLSLTTNDEDLTSLKCMELLEILSEELSNVDYTENSHWKIILERICQEYTQVVMKLLENQMGFWNRLWAVFVRMLKNQLIFYKKDCKAPINSLLSIMEHAFKGNFATRCKAYESWNVLIDVLHTTSIDRDKGLMLLLKPLKSYNAKSQEVALAKQNTWWHLITTYQSRLEKHNNEVIKPFLTYNFGNEQTGSTQHVPGFLGNIVKKQGVEMFIELFGHYTCKGCVSVEKLIGRYMTTTFLIQDWNMFSHCLMVCTRIFLKDGTDITLDQMKCLWRSFISVIADLPENMVSKDIVCDLLMKTRRLVEENIENPQSRINLYYLMLVFLEENNLLQSLLKIKDICRSNDVLFSIILKILHDNEQLLLVEDSMSKLKMFTNLIVNISNDSLQWILERFLSQNNTLALWSALVESVQESTALKADFQKVQFLLLWPLKSTVLSAQISYALIWKKTYTSCTNQDRTKLDKQICDILISRKDQNASVFVLYILLFVLENTLYNDNGDIGDTIESVSKLIHKSMTTIPSYDTVKEIFHIIIDDLILLSSYLVGNKNITATEHLLATVRDILKMTNHMLEANSEHVQQVVSDLKKILESLITLFEIDSYLVHRSLILDELLNCSSLTTDNTLLSHIMAIIMKFSTKCQDEPHKEEMNKIETAKMKIEMILKKQNNSGNSVQRISKTCTPNINKEKITATNIQNKEAYVVINNKYKFNPKKLTENQKEKLQRKREDIPALYQDLSQSQDNVMLVKWTADSQDTSVTKSSSRSVDADISSMLKNMPNTEVVPKIMENILSEVKSDTPNEQKLCLDTNPICESKKSNRLPLKDRVFKNVRNLIEKSKSHNPTEDVINQTINESVPKTPENPKKQMLISSAPPKICSDRPSRIKKMPKKFENTKLLDLKKKRRDSVSPLIENFSQDLQCVEKPAVQNNITVTIDAQADKAPTNNRKSEIVDKDRHIPKKRRDSVLPLIENFSQDLQCVEKPAVQNNITVTIDAQADKAPTNNRKSEIVDKDRHISKKRRDSVLPLIENFSQDLECVEKPAVQNNITVTIDAQADKAPTNNRKSEIVDKDRHIPKKRRHSVLPLTESLQDLQCVGETAIQNNISLKIDAQADKAPTNNSDSEIVEKDRYISKIVAEEMPENNEVLAEQVVISDADERSKENSNCLLDASNKNADGSVHTDVLILNDIDSQDNGQKRNKTRRSTKSRLQCELAIDTIEGRELMKSLVSNVLETDVPIKTRSQRKLNLNNNNTPKTLKKKKEISNAKNKYKSIDEISTEDVIESSQDSTSTTVSIRCTKTRPKSNDVVSLNKLVHTDFNETQILSSDSETDSSVIRLNVKKEVSEDDIELSRNKTAVQDTTIDKLTEEMDTEPVESEVQCINEVEKDSQSLAEADTEPIDSETIAQITMVSEDNSDKVNGERNVSLNDTSKSILEPFTTEVYSPTKDEESRMKEFLNNTIEISPIKTMSPIKEATPSPTNRKDYVVVKLATPVQNNGEPFEKDESPEIFTEEKNSPEPGDLSPTRRAGVIKKIPFSLRKTQGNKCGRGAQMLGLCANDKQKENKGSDNAVNQTKKHSSEENIMQNMNISHSIGEDYREDTVHVKEHFLLLKRSLPSADCSPSVPILKRRITDVEDPVSPATKRKRVSFPDPPVSTSVAVEKYIEPHGLMSPKNSQQKLIEKRQKCKSNNKSRKKLENTFKLNEELVQVCSVFLETPNANEVEMSPLEQTPVAEIVTTSELDNTEPICKELINCTDSIENIASELSSTSMGPLLIKELEGKVDTVGDLAKMTELEINRLCIRTPKVQVAKRVLADYAKRIIRIKTQDIAVETEKVEMKDVDLQTDLPKPIKTVELGTQTESPIGTIEEMIALHMQKGDLVDKLSENLNVSSVMLLEVLLKRAGIWENDTEPMNANRSILSLSGQLGKLICKLPELINSPNCSSRDESS